MKLLRSELKSEFNKRLFDMSARELPDRGTIFYDDHITCELSAKIVQFGFQLSGVIKATTKYECVRCLCNNLKDVTLPIKLWLSAKEILTGDDDQEMVHFPKNIDHIEISDTIADIIRLAGLCPKCGINMNQSSCDCRVDSHDSPWNVLNNF
jgi:uncharacterized metal-binding protein YceD (DUF177 family)